MDGTVEQAVEIILQKADTVLSKVAGAARTEAVDQLIQALGERRNDGIEEDAEIARQDAAVNGPYTPDAGDLDGDGV